VRGTRLAATGGVARGALGVGLIAVVAAVAAVGCAGPQVAKPGTRGATQVADPPPLVAEAEALCARGAAFDADERAGGAASAAEDLAAYEGRPITAVTVTGAPTLAGELAREVALAPGDTLTRAAVADQLRRLWAIGLVDDAAAHVTAAGAHGVVLELRVRERARIRAVTIERRGDVADRRLRRLRALEGVIDDPGRSDRTAHRLEDDLRNLGHWRAAVATRRRAAAGGGVELCVGIAAGPRYVIASIGFPGSAAMPTARIAAELARGNGAINAVGGVYRGDLLGDDLERILAAYHDLGHVMAKFEQPRFTVDERRARIAIEIPVDEGDRFTMGAIDVTGVDAARAARYRALAGLAPGAVFSRSALRAGIDRIAAAEQRDGRPGAVEPITHLDVERRTIGIELEVAP
jgi:outer membrane protein insertion porin family